MSVTRHILQLFALTSCVLFTAIQRLPADDEAGVEPSSSLEAQMAKWVKQLGAEEYVAREKAESELKSLGLKAFDVLHEAQNHFDIEVASRARYLLRSMLIDWTREDDPPEVKNLLRGYKEKANNVRSNLLDQLSKLPDRKGILALCRLARFETSDVLSKRAALLVMQQAKLTEEKQKTKLSVSINEEVGLSKRVASTWLRTYSKTLKDAEKTLDAWKEISKREETVSNQAPEKTSEAIVRDLLRWRADLLEDLKRPQEALAVMLRTIDFLDGSEAQILEMVDWFRQRKAWTAVEAVHERHSDKFATKPLLLYRLADSLVQLNKKADAAKAAAKALEVDKTDPLAHIRVAYNLQNIGMFQWCESEYRHAISVASKNSREQLQARFFLSEMLHDIQKELAAAEALQPVVDAMDADEKVKTLIKTEMGREPGGIRSRMHFFYAEHHRTSGDKKKLAGHLLKGIEKDPTDADALIAMYRADIDDNWKKDVKTRIEKAVNIFRERIRTSTQKINAARSESEKYQHRRDLAAANNQLAWLVSNTEGDFDEAIKCSHRSLELRPNTAGYLDTLGRCYYAKGDYENAIKYQAQAVKLDPHSGQIVRQLELFKKEAEEKGKVPKPKAS